MKHPALGLKARELHGGLEPPEGFEQFSSALDSFPEGRVSGVKALHVHDFEGSSRLELEDAVLGIRSSASGSLGLELHGKAFARRVFQVGPGEELELKYRSDGDSYLYDTVHLAEGARLAYKGRFRGEGHFVNRVRVVHSGRGSGSEVDVRGLVFGRAEVLPSAELETGCRGSSTSLSSLVVMFGGAEVEAVPSLVIGEPDTKAFHSFRKVRLTPEQLFYLHSRGIGEGQVAKFYEQQIMGD